jgi:predicted secreted protein
MSYTEQTWENDKTSADAAHLSHIESGIKTAQSTAEEGKTKAESALTNAASSKTLGEEGKTKAEAAQTTANTAKTEAGEGKTKASEAKTKAEEAKTKAEENKTALEAANKITASEKTSSYTLILSDSAKVIEATKSSGGAIVITVPKAVFSSGEVVEVAQLGTEKVEFVAESGLTLKSPGSSKKTRTQYSTASIRFRSGTDAVISGDLE